MQKINVLDRHTAELIAAGEVVERPASIVKELVENAIDAGATAVTVEIKNGGIRYIRISDNGEGISREDIQYAFLRHATSKIKSQDDLDTIATMGFRGEALASIAAVSRVEVITRTKDDLAGTFYAVEGGEELDCRDTGCPVGTTFTIRDVFYNTPARMKFLKKDVTEGNGVAGVVEKAALANVNVAFRFIRDGQTKLQTPGDGKLISCVYQIFGREFAQNVIDISYKQNGLQVSGIIIKPEMARASRSHQNFFINSRYVQSKTCMAALEQAYRGSLMVGRFPGCVLNLDIPYGAVDVNVHPAKTQVRFSDEKSVFDLVYYGVKTALQGSNLAPELKQSPPKSTSAKPTFLSAAELNPTKGIQQRLSVEEYKQLVAKERMVELKGNTKSGVMAFASPQLPYNEHILMESKIQPAINMERASAPEQTEAKRPETGRITTGIPDLIPPVQAQAQTQDCAPERPLVSDAIPQTVPERPKASEESVFDNARLVGEVFDTYLILQKQGELIFIDKHAAHERLLYNKLRKQGIGDERQVLLEPLILQLSQDEYGTALENLELFEKLGIAAEDFGNGSLLIREAAPVLTSLDLTAIVSQFIQKLSHGGGRNWLPGELEDMFHTMACRAAVKAHDKTPPVALEKLLRLLREDADTQHCPHGRPIAVRLTKNELEKRFGRLG